MGLKSKKRFYLTLQKLGYVSYQQYLESIHWAELRARFRASGLWAGNCFVCGAKGQLDFHHKTYKRLGREWLMDIVPLCRDCHDEVHRYEASHEDAGLWSAVRKVKNIHLHTAGIQSPRSGHTAPLRGTVRAVQPSARRGHDTGGSRGRVCL